MAKEPTIFVTRAEVEALVRREKEKASLATTCLSLRPLYPPRSQPSHTLLGIQFQVFKNLTSARAIPRTI